MKMQAMNIDQIRSTTAEKCTELTHFCRRPDSQYIWLSKQFLHDIQAKNINKFYGLLRNLNKISDQREAKSRKQENILIKYVLSIQKRKRKK